MALWISHRGVREGATVENTEAAFRAAVRRGFKNLETDVRLTADHELVLAHDIDLSRLGGDNVPLVTRTRKQLEQTKLPDGQCPYFFDQFITEYKELRWVLDIKPETSAAVLRILEKTVSSYIPLDQFCKKASFVLWTHADEEFVRNAFPGVKVYANQRRCWRAGLSSLCLGGRFAGMRQNDVYSLPPELMGRSLFRKELVDRYHAKGARVLAFLPRSEAEFRAALAAGFDEILSDGWIVR